VDVVVEANMALRASRVASVRVAGCGAVRARAMGAAGLGAVRGSSDCLHI
jgi:hypothetical protein